MADASLKRRLRIAALAAAIAVGVPVAAYATYPVIDTSAIAKLSDQLSKMQQQIDQLKQHTEWLTKLSAQVQDQLDAVGRLGKIALPLLNMEKVANQLLRDVQCLKPDLSRLMPGLRPEELDFGSICEGRDLYREMLWYDPDEVPADGQDGTAGGGTTGSGSGSGGAGSSIPSGGNPYSQAGGAAVGAASARWRTLEEARKAVQARREELTKETATTGMAQADLAATKTAKANEEAVKDLENAAKAAQDTNTRLAVIAQGTVLQNRQLVQQNQMLAELVKIQSVMLMNMSTPVAKRPKAPDDKGAGK